MNNVTISYHDKNIEATVIYEIDWKRIASLFISMPLNFKFRLKTMDDLVDQCFNHKKDIKLSGIRHSVMQHNIQLKKFINLAKHTKCYNLETLINAIKWHISVTESVILLLDTIQTKKKISRAFIQELFLLKENATENKNTCIKRVSHPTLSRESIDDKRIFLNIPQRVIPDLDTYFSKVEKKKSPYLLVGLMK